MELILLDNNFQEVKRIDLFHSLIWKESYYEVGSFELHLINEDIEAIKTSKYLYRNDINKLALIYDIDFNLQSDGQVNLSIAGKFIEDILNDEVIEKEKTYTGNHSQIVKSIVNEYYPNLMFINTNFGVNTTLKLDGEYIGLALYDFLKTQELSYQIDYDYLTNNLTFKVFKGLDRTENQQENSWLILGDENQNITNISYSKSINNFKNYAIITGDGEKTSPSVVYLDRSYGSPRKKIRIQTSLSRKNNNVVMSDIEYKKSLEQKGIEELENYKIVELFECEVINVDYRLDYNLGDLCTFKLNSLNIIAFKRVIEVIEIFENGNKEVKVKFGDDFINLTKLIRR